MDFQNSRMLLGQILVDYGVITPCQLEEVISRSLASDLLIGECLMRHGLVNQQQLDAALVDQQRRRAFYRA